MFGGDLEPPLKPKEGPKPRVWLDIELPCQQPGRYGHMARRPNTDYHVRYLHYKQRLKAADNEMIAGNVKVLKEDQIRIKYDKHADKSRFNREIEKRVEARFRDYEASIDVRREKLQELYAKEEREFYMETIDTAQRGGETRVSEMKERANLLKAQREQERMAVVKAKRLQQYSLRCEKLRTVLAKKHLIESKDTQLQQMRENEARRESEREMDKMWYDVMVKEMGAKAEREEYDAIDRWKRNRAQTDVLDMQIKGKELLREEAKRVAHEDFLEMVKLQEQLRREEIEALDAKRRKRDQTSRELQEQLDVQERFLAQRRKEEETLERAFTLLTQIELDREKAKVYDATQDSKREMAQYREHLKQLEEERKEEERQLNELLNFHKEEIQRKQDEAQCKMQRAKEAMQADVMKGRAEQLECKRQEAEAQLSFKQAENELIRMACETNERLQAESDRLQKEAAKQYSQDLSKQIEYNNLMRERERQELERQLVMGRKEEETFQKMVEEITKSEIRGGKKHPFRSLIEKYDCHCPEYSVQPPY